MKITIIEDSIWDVKTFKRILESAGHEVLGIFVSRFLPDTGEKGVITEAVQENIVLAVKEFGPDKILLDHSLGMKYTGETLAKEFGLDKAKLIGTSTTYEQNYCDQHFLGKGKPTQDSKLLTLVLD